MEGLRAERLTAQILVTYADKNMESSTQETDISAQATRQGSMDTSSPSGFHSVQILAGLDQAQPYGIAI